MTDQRQPGDFAAVRTAGQVGALIRIGQFLNGDGFRDFEHAMIYIGNDTIVEAEPGGARARIRGVQSGDLWSTGLWDLTDATRQKICEAAIGYAEANGGHGVPYGWADYFALAAHRFRVPVPGLEDYIAGTKSMICSQLADRVYQDAGVQLFDDDRWNGYVTPADLANLVLARHLAHERT